LEHAQKAMDKVFQKNKIPVITCGTGFYLKGFLYGLFPVPKIKDGLRQHLESLTRATRWEELSRLDIAATEKIHYNDDYRVTRALEVILSGGGLWSKLKPVFENGLVHKKEYRICGFLIDTERQILYDCINSRAKEMIDGVISETKKVMELYGENCPALKSLGYNFAVENIKGKINIENFYELFSQSHRNYAKKQVTWFSKEKILEKMSWQESFQKIQKIGKW
jgi:tRNA dimethylallyltransferase